MPDENALAEAQTAIESPADEKGSAPPAVTESAPLSEQTTETPPERPSRAKERIQELAADKRAAIEFAELQRQRADRLEAELKAKTPTAETKGQPKLADFQTPEEWATAHSEWAVAEAEKRVLTKVETRETERSAQAAEAERQKAFDASLREAAKGIPNYFEAVSDPSATWLHAGVVDVLKDFPDKAGVLTHYLATHPEEGREIAALPPRQMARALGRLEITVSEKPKPAPTKPKVTEAPAPPTPVGGGSAVAVDYDKLASTDTAAYIKARRAERRARGERW